ncbi:MAG: hypothetical protein OXI15_22085, partial [Chromatiales bacterium]|nr:hypothetical protein [Chromatiales bacterium]
ANALTELMMLFSWSIALSCLNAMDSPGGPTSHDGEDGEQYRDCTPTGDKQRNTVVIRRTIQDWVSNICVDMQLYDVVSIKIG